LNVAAATLVGAGTTRRSIAAKAATLNTRATLRGLPAER
jgi:hypothetical protein